MEVRGLFGQNSSEGGEQSLKLSEVILHLASAEGLHGCDLAVAEGLHRCYVFPFGDSLGATRSTEGDYTL